MRTSVKVTRSTSAAPSTWAADELYDETDESEATLSPHARKEKTRASSHQWSSLVTFYNCFVGCTGHQRTILWIVLLLIVCIIWMASRSSLPGGERDSLSDYRSSTCALAARIVLPRKSYASMSTSSTTDDNRQRERLLVPSVAAAEPAEADKMASVAKQLSRAGRAPQPHVCLGGFGGDQLPIPTRYKISAKSRGLYTCNVKVLAWGDQSPPTPTYGPNPATCRCS